MATFTVNRGDGNETVNGYDAIVFGPGISYDSLQFRYNGALDVSIPTDNVYGPFTVGVLCWAAINSWTWADGTTKTLQEIKEHTLAQESTDGNDGIIAFPGSPNVITPGKGDDVVTSHGQTTLVYNFGDGNDSFGSDDADGVQNDVVSFGSGIHYDDLRFQNDSKGLHILMPDNGSITLGNNPAQTFTFADGTTKTLDNLEKAYIAQAETSGNDSIYGFIGDDSINGGAGNDTIDGFYGNDTINGGLGNDILVGGPGDDIIYSSSGSDTIYGGVGTDTYVISPDAGAKVVIMSFKTAENDIIQLNDFTTATDFAHLKMSLLGSDTIIKLDANETLTLKNVNYNNLTAASFVFGHSAPQDLTLTGTSGNDTVTGGAGNDTIGGGLGIDLLQGGAGDDTLMYSADFNWTHRYVAHNVGSPDAPLNGEMVAADPRNGSYDVFDGGTGYDKLVLADGGSALFLDDGISASPLSANTARIANIEEIDGGNGNDIVDLTSTRFSYGNVLIKGMDGNDILWSNAGNDTIYGGNGDDVINGGAGNNLIFGDAGNDTITSSLGLDTISGGAGNDVFSFRNLLDSNSSQYTTITDFEQSIDRIDVHNLGFTAIAPGAASGSVMGYTYDAAHDQTIIASANGFKLALIGHINLVNSDFTF